MIYQESQHLLKKSQQSVQSLNQKPLRQEKVDNFNSSNKFPQPIIFPQDRQKYSNLQRYFTIGFLILFIQIPLFLLPTIVWTSMIGNHYYLYVPILLLIPFHYFLSKNRLVVSLVNKYFPPTLYFRSFIRYYEEDIEDEKNQSNRSVSDYKMLFGSHPHSIMPYGLVASINAGKDPLSKIKALGSRLIFHMPLTGSQAKLWGCQTVNPNNMKKLMKEGKSLGICPGGFEQFSLTSTKQYRIYIKQRKGFIKYAIRYGYTIYPVLFFNEHKAFWTLDFNGASWLLNLKLFLNKYKILFFLFSSRFGPIITPNFDMISVVGRGIKTSNQNSNKKQKTNISQEQIDNVHKLYIQQIERLYEKYKQMNGNLPLRIL